MARRGTTVVAWVIGLGALGAQAVVVPMVTAILRDPAPVEIRVPAIEVTAPALPRRLEAEPATDVDTLLGEVVAQRVALSD